MDCLVITASDRVWATCYKCTDGVFREVRSSGDVLAQSWVYHRNVNRQRAATEPWPLIGHCLPVLVSDWSDRLTSLSAGQIPSEHAGVSFSDLTPAPAPGVKDY